MADYSIKKKELKNLLVELFEEDKTFFHKLMPLMLLRQDTIDFFHRLNLEVLRNYFKSEKTENLELLIDREKYKYLVEQKSSLLNSIYEKGTNFNQEISSKKARIEQLKKKYGIKKEAIEDLQELWKDEKPAEELVKMLSK